MTLPNLFGEDDKKGEQSSQSSLPDLFPSTEVKAQPPEPAGYFSSMVNISRRIFALAGIGTPNDINEVRNMVQKNMEFSPQNAEIGTKVVDDLQNFFAKTTWKGTGDKLHSMLSGVAKDPVGTVGGLPMGIVHMVVTNPTNVLLGADATQNQLQQQSTEDGAREVKDLLGTAAGVLVGAGASKLLGEATLARTAAGYGMDRATAKAALAGDLAPAVASADTRSLVTGLQQGTGSTLGKIGRRIVDGTLEGAAFGATQSAVANAGKDDVAAQMLMQGVMFAPLGAAVEFMKFKASDPLETALHSAAKDVAYTRQIQASMSRSMG
jgi:hypothetical protein